MPSAGRSCLAWRIWKTTWSNCLASTVILHVWWLSWGRQHQLVWGNWISWGYKGRPLDHRGTQCSQCPNQGLSGGGCSLEEHKQPNPERRCCCHCSVSPTVPVGLSVGEVDLLSVGHHCCLLTTCFHLSGDYLLPSQVDAKIEDAINEIGQLVDSPGEYLQEFEDNFRESFNGVDLKNLRVAESKFQSIREKICQQSQGILAQRFDPRSRTVFQACQVLDLASWPLNRDDLGAYGEEEILVIFDHLKTIPSSGREISQERIDARGSLVVEWRDLKADYCSVNGFKEVVSHIVRYKQRFPLLNHILQVVRVLPTSSTCCDKGRCSLQKVRRNSRSRLTLDQINDLLTLAVNGPPIGSFDGKRALDSWFEEKSGNSHSLSAEVLSRMSTAEQKSVLHNMDMNAEYYPDIWLIGANYSANMIPKSHLIGKGLIGTIMWLAK